MSRDIGLNVKFRKFKMADGRHIAYREIAISTKNHQILIKFGTQMQIWIWNSVTVRWPNMKIYKIQDGGRPPFKNSRFLVMTQQPIARFQWQFVWGNIFSQNFGKWLPAFYWTYFLFCFRNAIWASASGAFCIISPNSPKPPVPHKHWWHKSTQAFAITSTIFITYCNSPVHSRCAFKKY